MFTKVLVANRGEIAVRVQQTLHAMGVRTVAVYSDPDAAAPHVRMADGAVRLPGATPTETYLNVPALIQASRQTGAEAVHPGYGFLSESPAFARACRDAGLVFIGPSPEAMELLGDKLRAKELAASAGVPVAPSVTLSAVNSPRFDGDALRRAQEVGFPLLVKASAGGGGRGMRLVSGPEDLGPALEASAREAASAFGDGRVFLERYLPRARHVEVQVLGDVHDDVVYLGERECSLQRRYQKVVEETPSPALTPDLRRRMGEAAVALARAAGYTNAGTVEFLLAPDGAFFFLEANTRLQVEHPITEMVTGLDLVELQARIAAGEPLPLGQEDVQPRGHAIEARIYAEDPAHGFAPSTGTLLHWAPPSGPGLRLDSGVEQGQGVTVYYDPLLAKLCAWGPDRPVALVRLAEALGRFAVLGVITNIAFLRQVLLHPDVQAGAYHTRFLDEHPDLLKPADAEGLAPVARALAAWATSHAAPPTGGPARGGAAPSGDVWSPWRGAGSRRLP